jgi:multidrug efflux pump subunit AcrA (membrane-fusion protein)
MSANVDIVTESKDNVLLIPAEAVINDNGDKFVLLKTENGKIVTQKIFVGMTDDSNVEIIGGLVEGDTIIIKSDGYVIPSKKESGSNPFMPKFNNDKKENKK